MFLGSPFSFEPWKNGRERCWSVSDYAGVRVHYRDSDLSWNVQGDGSGA